MAGKQYDSEELLRFLDHLRWDTVGHREVRRGRTAKSLREITSECTPYRVGCDRARTLLLENYTQDPDELARIIEAVDIVRPAAEHALKELDRSPALRAQVWREFVEDHPEVAGGPA